MAERCGWCGTDPLYVAYHDHEWGVPERDARALWEKLVLDGFQAGLSWITILRKRDNFRAAFEDKAPHSALMRDMPVFVITHPMAALLGLAAYARTPGRFGVETSGRRWRP